MSVLTHSLSSVRGVLCTLSVLLNTILFVPPLLGVTLFKVIVPVAAWRRLCTRVLVWIADSWVGVNGAAMRALHPTRWEVEGLEAVDPDGWYLVVCNHQAWSDIPILQSVFHRRAPFLKFFLKQKLIWVPLLGAAWWALDFPFMKRYSREQIEKNPGLRGKDLETTRRACEKFEQQPVAILNFIEGTRFTREKHARQESPYRHLLKPRAGGIGFVLGALGDRVQTLLDVTIVYSAQPLFWDFLCGRIPVIRVRVVAREIPDPLRGRSYLDDTEYREAVQAWVRKLWEEKDAQIEASHAASSPARAAQAGSASPGAL